MQLEFLLKKDLRYIKAYSHGGVSLKKRAKIQRPLLEGKPTHVVFKSSKAKGDLSFYKHKRLVARLLKEKSRKFYIVILDWVNMGNHLHLKVKFKDRKKMGQFLKSFSALLARKITGAKKGVKFGKFWDGLVFTRVLTTKIEELGLKGYFEVNHKQREYSYQEREFFRKKFNAFVYRLKYTRSLNREYLLSEQTSASASHGSNLII